MLLCRPWFSALAAAGYDATPSNATNSRNADQIDQLLAGLSELRAKQQQGLVVEDDDEDEWNEFEAGEEGTGTAQTTGISYCTQQCCSFS